MGKPAKKIIKYRNASLPQNLDEVLANADDQDLKILVALMMAADQNGEVSEDISIEEVLGIDKTSVDASVKFWRGAGIIDGARSCAQRQKASAVKSDGEKPAQSEEDNKSAPEIPSAHRNGVVEQSASMVNYGSAELATLFERRKVTSEFIDEAQRVWGKTFNTYDTGIVVGMVDQLGFDEEAVLAILAYVSRMGRKGLRYCEKVAISLYDDGYVHVQDIMARIEVIERSKEIVSKIRHLFGIGDRTLSKTEKELSERWAQTYGYDIDVIKLAYDITIDRIQKPVPKYTNSILEGWHTAGLKTVEEIVEHERKPKDNGADAQKSYDLDGFFDAAIRRSYDDLK